jgi:hypothetical protein
MYLAYILYLYEDSAWKALCCALQARDTIRIDYYLNSSDAETKQAELNATRRKASEQVSLYFQGQTTRRGHMLVQTPPSS